MVKDKTPGQLALLIPQRTRAGGSSTRETITVRGRKQPKRKRFQNKRRVFRAVVGSEDSLFSTDFILTHGPLPACLFTLGLGKVTDILEPSVGFCLEGESWFLIYVGLFYNYKVQK